MLLEGCRRVQAAQCGDCVKRVFSRCNWYTSPLKCLEVSAGSWERLGTGTPLGFQNMRCFKLYRYSINTQEKFIGFPRVTGTGQGPDHLGALGSNGSKTHRHMKKTAQTSLDLTENLLSKHGNSCLILWWICLPPKSSQYSIYSSNVVALTSSVCRFKVTWSRDRSRRDPDMIAFKPLSHDVPCHFCLQIQFSFF